MINISLVIITLNEENNIGRCIRSVDGLKPIINDVVVLDTESTDKTIEIAKSLGARTFVEKWRGYGPQKSRAVELASNDWVLSLDADEACSENLIKEIKELAESSSYKKNNGFEMPRVSFHLGRWIRHGGWYPDKQMRFFNRQECGWSLDKIHERAFGENIKLLKNDILHWPFDSIEDQVNTNNKYSTLAAKDLFSKGKKAPLVKIIFKPISKFLETYVLKKGFLDGFAGFVISIGAAYSMFLKWVKLRQMYVSVSVSEDQKTNKN